MPRRASSGINIGQIAGIAAAILGFVVIAALLVKLIAGGLLGDGGGTGSSRKSSGGSSRDAAPLNLLTYRDNGNSLRGNVYRVDGKVEERRITVPPRGCTPG